MTAIRGESLRGEERATSEKGFTLMEMLVVLVIIGLISAVAIPQVTRLLESAKHKAAGIQLETVGQSLGFYQLDVGNYPSTKEGLAVLWEAPDGNDLWNGPYVRDARQLKDPWGRDLIYRSPGEKGAFDLLSYGADGAEGGSGDDKDIRYSN